MKRITLLACLITLAATAVLSRPVRVLSVSELVTGSKLAFVGRVKSVKPSGITTSLSYPTWEKVVFEWLLVDVEVIEPLKGTRRGEIVQVALLSVDENKGPSLMINAPGMIDPKQGMALLLFLSPTPRTNIFASLTAPYDDDQAIFRLDRNYWAYSPFRDGKEAKDSPFYERHKIIWSLMKEGGEIDPNGADSFRKSYAKEIEVAPKNNMIYLEWEKLTNHAGWSQDVPKGWRPKTNDTANSPRDK